MIVRPLIEQVCRPIGLTPDVVEAIVRVESNGDPWAYRSEPSYRYLWDVRARAPFRELTDAEIASEDAPADFSSLAGSRNQEWWAQQASWGLMQIMGAVAREQGFAGPFLTQLCDPLTNLRVGARVFRSLVLWADGNLPQAAAAYNAGKARWTSTDGEQYAARVQAALTTVQRERAGGAA